jgi:pimeloyl-ACP methyl ester carboxylesterase
MNQILLLHGALGSSVHFAPLKARLEKDLTVHTPDFPGHGGSEMPSNFSIEFFAQHIEEYCRIHALNQIAVFGYSMGGYVALYLANKNPGIFSRIITLGTMFYWDEMKAAKEVSRLQPEIIEIKVPQLATSLKNLHFPHDWKEILKKTSQMLAQLGSNDLLKKEVLQTIQPPVLVMQGDSDKMVNRNQTIDVFETLPYSELAILPGIQHPIELCDVNLLEVMIRRFVKQQ